MGEHIGPRLRACDEQGKWRPKRMLALDGGGARGIVTVAFLEKIEETLRNELQAEIQAAGLTPDQFRLHHYFDVIGGTSVGALIAAMLAKGMSAEEVREKFEEWSSDIFRPLLGSVFKLRNRHDATALQNRIKELVEDERLDSTSLKTGLVVVTKNARTGSVWVLANNPFAQYYNFDHANPDTIPNREYKLVDLLRASTAAPTYFKHQQLKIHSGPAGDSRIVPEDRKWWFVDGGVSPHNNPALQLFMMAGMKGYRLGGTESGVARRNDKGIAWPLGADQLQIVSVGTGRFAIGFRPRWWHKAFPPLAAVQSLQTMISDGQKLALAMLQWLSNPSRSWQIDSEIGNLEGELLPGSTDPKAMLSFVRYDIELKTEWLEEHTGRWVAPFHLDEMIDFTNTKSQKALYELARTAAASQVDGKDFPPAFRWIWHQPASAGPASVRPIAKP